VYAAAAVIWLMAFAFQTGGLVRRCYALGRASETAETLYSRLDRDARLTTQALNAGQKAVADLEFLQGLPSVLPEDKDKGYLRTQRAVSEEVKALRRVVAPRLKNSLYVVVDAKANKLYLKNGFKLLWQADCSVGRGGVLSDKKTGRRWEFVTSRAASSGSSAKARTRNGASPIGLTSSPASPCRRPTIPRGSSRASSAPTCSTSGTAT
jgi:hypothetical protein